MMMMMMTFFNAYFQASIGQTTEVNAS